jgi:integrase/recombinase XerC
MVTVEPEETRGSPTAAANVRGLDDASLACLHEALRHARSADDERSPFAIIASCLQSLGVELPARASGWVDLETARDDWLARLRGSKRSPSTVAAYRTALDDLVGWLGREGIDENRLSERTIVSYLDDYRRRARPAAATYYRRFTLLRRFFRWLASHAATPDPFVDLDAPPKPAPVADWLNPAEFERLLAGAASPRRELSGLAERDRLVLLTLVVTGLRRSELTALSWRDLDLDGPRPSLLVRAGKGGRPRRQPLAPALRAELAGVRAKREAVPDAPVFCGLRGGRLQPTILAGIIRRAADRAGLKKRVTAHTLRHTAATWLRHATGDTRLVAEYLGHADLSTVHRYAHVAAEELDDAAAKIAETAGLDTA